MKKLTFISLIVIVISLLVSVGAYLFTGQQSQNSPPADLQCNVLQENENGINILIFSTIENAEKYKDYFLSVTPFSENKEKFSFYNIDQNEYSAPCNLYQQIALLCSASEIVKTAAICPHDYIVVINDEYPASIRSSSYQNILSLNAKHPLSVFAHEFYHAFDNAAEEYVAEGSSLPSGSQNCQKSCDDFRSFPEEGELGCYQGCTKSALFREFENGFMRSLYATSYGENNKFIIQDEIGKQFKKSSITGFAIKDAGCENSQFYLIELQFQNNELKVLSKELVSGCPNPNYQFGTLEYSVKDNSGETIYSSTASPEKIFVTDFVEETGVPTEQPRQNDQPFFITVPYTDKESDIEISNSEGTLTNIPLKQIGSVPCKL